MPKGAYVGVPKSETVSEATNVLTGEGKIETLDVTGVTLNSTPIVPSSNPSLDFRTEGDVIKVNINVTTDITELSLRFYWVDGGVQEEPFDPVSLNFTVYSQDGSVYDIKGTNTTITALMVSLNKPFPVGTYTIEIALSSDVPYFFGFLYSLFIQAKYNKDGSGVAHKVKKIYTGVDNVARKVKKGYVGVGGVARPFFSAEGLEYYGTITPLSAARDGLAATTVGKYALFGGGGSNNVDAYNNTLTRRTPTDLMVVRGELAATTVGNYALFGGGYGVGAYQDTVDAYNISLTRSTPTVLSVARKGLAATTVGNYALFGGGRGISPAYKDTVDAYNIYLTRSTPTVLSVARYSLSSTTVGNYALFGGGGGNGYEDAVDAYDTNLTRSTPTVLSVARHILSATTVGTYALFGGGGGNGYEDAVDAYDTNLTRSTPTVLSVGRESLAATTVGNYALFGGGGGYKDTVDSYDTNLTRSTPTVLSVARRSLAATTVGNYALFGGGEGRSYTDKDTVDAYVDAVGAEIYAYLRIAGGESAYTLIDLVDGTAINIAKDFQDLITLKRGHSYMFTPRDPDVALWKRITDVVVTVRTSSVSMEYSYDGAIGYDNDTFYIAPNISIPDNFGNPEDPSILYIIVSFGF